MTGLGGTPQPACGHQNLAGRCLAILELSTYDLRRILAASSDIVAAVATTGAGEYRHLEIP